MAQQSSPGNDHPSDRTHPMRCDYPIQRPKAQTPSPPTVYSSCSASVKDPDDAPTFLDNPPRGRSRDRAASSSSSRHKGSAASQRRHRRCNTVSLRPPPVLSTSADATVWTSRTSTPEPQHSLAEPLVMETPARDWVPSAVIQRVESGTLSSTSSSREHDLEDALVEPAPEDQVPMAVVERIESIDSGSLSDPSPRMESSGPFPPHILWRFEAASPAEDTAWPTLRSRGLSQHRDTFELLQRKTQSRTRVHPRGPSVVCAGFEDLPFPAMLQLAKLLDHDSFLAARSTCQSWCIALTHARPLRFPASFKLTSAIIQNVLGYLDDPADFDAACNVCHSWKHASLSAKSPNAAQAGNNKQALRNDYTSTECASTGALHSNNGPCAHWQVPAATNLVVQSETTPIVRQITQLDGTTDMQTDSYDNESMLLNSVLETRPAKACGLLFPSLLDRSLGIADCAASSERDSTLGSFITRGGRHILTVHSASSHNESQIVTVPIGAWTIDGFPIRNDEAECRVCSIDECSCPLENTTCPQCALPASMITPSLSHISLGLLNVRMSLVCGIHPLCAHHTGKLNNSDCPLPELDRPRYDPFCQGLPIMNKLPSAKVSESQTARVKVDADGDVIMQDAAWSSLVDSQCRLQTDPLRVWPPCTLVVLPTPDSALLMNMERCALRETQH